jgi:hypothetical protein
VRGDVLLGGCDPVAQRVWTGKHVGAREALAMDMSLHGRCRVQARRPWPNLEDDLAAVAELEAEYVGQVRTAKELTNRC